MSDAAEPLDLGPIRERWLDWFGPMSVERNPVWPGREEDEEPDEYMARLDVPALLAEVERLRAALTTARRDALTEAADAIDHVSETTEGMYAGDCTEWLRARAAQEEGGSTLTPDERREWAADECAQERDAQEEGR